MAARSTKKISRKTAKVVPLVAVESDLFDAPLQLPSLKRVPLHVLHQADRGVMGPLFDFVAEYAPEESLEAFYDIDGSEMLAFMREWAKAAEVPTSGD